LNTVVVGRDPELRAIADFLVRDEPGPRALVLDGSAGIGKTTLWQAGVAQARERGWSVLVTRAAESEARMSYAGIGDLFSNVPETAFDALSAPLRRALDRALLRSDPIGGAPDPRAVSMAAGEVLHTLAADRPVVIAIDDAQWLDRPSARVLSFVLRRFTDENIAVLASVRRGSGSKGDPIDIDRAILDTTHLNIGPLAVGALGRILRVRTNQSLPRPYVVRPHQLTDRNPLFALEIARTTVADGPTAGQGEAWRVPKDLQNVLSARLATLPASAHRVLLGIAAMSQPTLELVLEVAGSSERSVVDLGRAEEAGIIERADGRVRFTHPLLASTVYVNATARERRALHVRLASVMSDPEERARHLALAAEEPDRSVATALDQAARHARARGAPDAAAELATWRAR
jgi:hypothetical protein